MKIRKDDKKGIKAIIDVFSHGGDLPDDDDGKNQVDEGTNDKYYFLEQKNVGAKIGHII